MAVKTSFYSDNELANLGLKSYGKNVNISRKASIYNAENITIGSNVRIDDFCILSGKITIGSYVHIAAYCGFFGREEIILEDFTGISARVSIYTANDDYFGNALTGPTVPDEFRKLDAGPVVLEKYVIVGCATVILPNTRIGIGSAIGALSLVKGKVPPWSIFVGIPAKFKKERKSSVIIKYEKDLLRKYHNNKD